MLTKFKTEAWGDGVIPVEVLRETSQSVVFYDTFWKREARELKVSDRHQYHDTWQAAHAHLVQRAEDEVALSRRALERAISELGNVNGMKPPQG